MKAGKRLGRLLRKAILVVDDHPMTRAGLAHLINNQLDMEVCAEASSPSEALQQISKRRPDLVLTDIGMPGGSGIEFIKDVVALHKGLPILVISMHDELIYAERVLRTGARGYIMKEAGGELLLLAIRRVLSGQVYVSGRVTSTLIEGLSRRSPRRSKAPIQKLSDREFEVFELIGQGKSTREIAQHLHLSPKTVAAHREHIRDKLRLSDSTSLIRYAVRWVEARDTGTAQ